MKDLKVRMEIHGAAYSLDDIADEKVPLTEDIRTNEREYKRIWPEFVPSPETQGMPGKMSYDPSELYSRKCIPKNLNSKRNRDLYSIVMSSPSRCKRPMTNGTENPYRAKHHCKLCENVLGTGMVISKIGNYYLTPNGYPYHENSSLLVNKSQKKKQEDLDESDIVTWMKASRLLNQVVFYNSIGAGASVKEHLHAQVVDSEQFIFEDKQVPLPIFNKKIVRRQKLKEDIDRLRDYPVDALIFKGKRAPEKVMYAINLLKKRGNAFNIIINKKEIYLIGRDASKEVLKCTGGKAGAYEIAGVAIVNNSKSYRNISYKNFTEEVSEASVSLDPIIHRIVNKK